MSSASCQDCSPEGDITIVMPLVNHLRTLAAHTSDINSLAFNNDFLASGAGDKSVRLWNLDESFNERACSPLIDGHTYSVHSVTFSPNQRWLATSSIDGKVILWDCKTGDKLAVFEHRNQAIIRVCRFSADSRLIASGSSDETLCLWDVATKQIIRTYEGHESPVNTLGFSPGDHYLVSGSSNGDLSVWSVQYNHAKILHFYDNAHDLGVNALDFSNSHSDVSSDNQVTYTFVSGGMDNDVNIWKLQAYPDSTDVKIVLSTSLIGHAGPIMDVRFSPQSSYIASASNDKSVRLWSMENHECVQVIEAHTRYVTCCAFSRDSTLLATGSNDKLVKIWKFADKNSAVENLVETELVDVSVPVPSSVLMANKMDINSMTKDHVCDWLKLLGLTQYQDMFSDNEIDGTELSCLSADSLANDLKIGPLGHRNKILRGIQDLKNNSYLLPQSDDGVHDEYLCPITREMMREPVMASDGYTYERNAIKSWMEAGNASSPMTNQILVTQILTPNRTLQMLIQRYRESNRK